MSQATAANEGIDAGGAVRPDEFRGALEAALERAAQDDRIGPLFAATRMRMRLRVTDLDLVLDIAASDGSRELTWSFGGGGDERPKLELEMDSATANRYLQGRESLAIAIARGHARSTGSSRAALVYLPAARLLCEPYRRVIQASYPSLVV